jgi:hypothetical protein
MKITFLGVSGALSAKYNSNMLIENKEDVMLFDCGEDVMHSLNAAGRKADDLTSVFISHLHMDHCGGLSWLAYYNYFIAKKRIILRAHESMISDLWSMLRPSLERLDGQDKMMTLNDYFEVRPIRHEQGGFLFGGGSCDLVKQLHVETKCGHMYSYGLIINCDDKKVFISSDTKKMNIPPTEKGHTYRYYDYDYIFCDCDVMNLGGVHPNYNDLVGISSDIKSNVSRDSVPEIWLYHYTNLDDYNGQFGEMPDAVKDGFAGFVKEGQIFNITNIKQEVKKAIADGPDIKEFDPDILKEKDDVLKWGSGHPDAFGSPGFKETEVKRDETIYDNNNKEKPFSSVGLDKRRAGVEKKRRDGK